MPSQHREPPNPSVSSPAGGAVSVIQFLFWFDLLAVFGQRWGVCVATWAQATDEQELS